MKSDAVEIEGNLTVDGNLRRVDTTDENQNPEGERGGY